MNHDMLRYQMLAAIVGRLSHVSDAIANGKGRGGRGKRKLLPVSGKRAPNTDHDARSQSPEESVLPDTRHFWRAYHDGFLYALHVRARCVYRKILFVISILLDF